jgi:hypothetical protein
VKRSNGLKVVAGVFKAIFIFLCLLTIAMLFLTAENAFSEYKIPSHELTWSGEKITYDPYSPPMEIDKSPGNRFKDYMSYDELAWQIIHIIDVAQSLDGIGNDCFEEVSFGTTQLIGRRPSTDAILIWGIISSLTHWASSNYIKKRSPKWFKVAYVTFDLSWKINTVYSNHATGIKLGQDNVSECG